MGMHSVDASWYDADAVAFPVFPASKRSLLLERRLVPAVTPAELLRRFNISNVRHLKVDAEGYDWRIIEAFTKCMALSDLLRPDEISWECNRDNTLPENARLMQSMR